MPTKRALIFVNGSLPDFESARRLIQPEDVLIAADGGTRHILSLGRIPSVIVGDLDSLSEQDRQRTTSGGITMLAYPCDKNETDLELALNHALEQGYDPILIVAALGGRLDQTLTNLSLLTNPDFTAHDIRLDDGVEQALFTRSRVELLGTPGDIVSLLPWGGEVTGVSTRGLKWPLFGETLSPHKTRGISNEILESAATITLESGILLIVHRRQSHG